MNTPLYNGWTAAYDDTGRLRTWNRFDGSGYTGTYEYDELGNLTLKDGNTYWYDAFGPHQVEQIGTEQVDYDVNGNMTRLPGNRYATYDAEGRLVKVCQGSCGVASPVVKATYGYDAEGQRVWAKTGPTTVFYFDGFDVDLTAQVITRHIAAGGRTVASTTMVEGSILMAAAIPARGPPPVVVARGVGAAMALGLLGVILARAKIEAWRRDYNERRPHGALGHLTPNEFATHRQEKRVAIGGANF